MTTTTVTAPLTEQTPREVDIQLAELERTYLTQARRAEDYMRAMRAQYARDENLTNAQVLARVPAYDYMAKAREEAQAKAREAAEAMKPLNAEYQRRGGWTRFFMVPGGHIHKDMNCATCNKMGKATEFGWLYDQAGLTEAEAVEAHGAILCTVCHPTAPVEWTNAYELAEAAKAAAKCPGSGKVFDRDLPHRKGYMYGNWGTCPECGDKPALTTTGKLRAHKPRD